MILAALICVFLSACGSSGGNIAAASGSGSSSSSKASSAESGNNGSADAAGKTLVVYFSATGTTKGVAKKIASVTGGDLYEIVPVQPYTDEDLDHNNNKSRTTVEQNNKSARPKIAGNADHWDSYSTVYLGYPIWWGEEPRILDTFVENNKFDGKTVIPFCTSGGSGIGQSEENLKSKAGSGTWLQGERFSGSTSKQDIKSWVSGLKIE